MKWAIVVVILAQIAAVLGAFPGYKVASFSETDYGLQGTLQLISGGPYGSDINTLGVQVYYLTNDILRIKIFDANNKRWEVPDVNILPIPKAKPQAPSYAFKASGSGSPFTFSVTRNSNNQSLFDTAIPNANGLIFEDEYLEIGTKLPRGHFIYGLGERIHGLRLEPGNTFTLFAKDWGTPLNKNIYASHPFYMEMRNGFAHGIFLLNSNAMDVVIADESLTYKTIGGILDFFIILGPSPASVISQYQTIIGFPHIPPYWALGWHQCRWGYHNVQDDINVVDNYAKNNLPLDTMWNDIDYMDQYRDFTLDPNNFPVSAMSSFVDKLHANGQHYMMIVDPGIQNTSNYQAYTDLLASGAYIRNAKGNPLVGKVWPGLVIFPDFLNPKIVDYWYNQLKGFHDKIKFDGMWIDMNEVSNFCNGECLTADSEGLKSPSNPPYVPGGVNLDASTVSMTATSYLGIEYNTHNLYGWSEGIVSNTVMEKLRGTRSVVISRSTFAGSGSHNGHWLGDNGSSFNDLYYSIPGVLAMQLFGVNLVGADVCGFGGDTTEELCTRWMQLGTLYPFARSHNSIGQRSQEPYAFGPTLLNSARDSLLRRYTLLPYFYTLFLEASNAGGTVWRPLFFEFPKDVNTYAIDRQFMIGSALLVTPVLSQGATTVQGYFPDAIWYSWYTGLMERNTAGQATLQAPISFIPIHIRGGSIIPIQLPALTTTASRKNPFTVIAALDAAGQAEGHLYLDDGESLDPFRTNAYKVAAFNLISNQTGNILHSTTFGNGYNGLDSLFLTNVTFLGVGRAPSKLTVNNAATSFSYSQQNKVLTVASIKLKISDDFTIVWN